MLYTAYFDESDSHGPEPNLTLAALLAYARQWELFGREIRTLQRRDRFRVFHATDFRAAAGEFDGWDLRKQMRLVSDLAGAIRDHLTEVVTITLPHRLYMNEYRADPVPKKMHLDSQFGVCFRWSLLRLLNIVVKNKKTNRLDIVLEDGHKNVHDCCRIFNELKVEINQLGHHTLGTIKILPKASHWQLMIADFQAHASFLSESRVRAGHPGYFDLAKGMPKRGQAGITQIEISPENLRALKTQWEEKKEERVAKWRAERDRHRAT